MPEREPQNSERTNIHEHGGLTPEHWREVVDRIGEPKNKTDQKLINYAQKVISGDFPDSGSYHREYLGHRHWLRLSFINTKDKIITPRKLPPWPKISYIVNPTVEEIKSYAKAETKAVYTLDDYFNIVFSSNNDTLRFNRKANCWEEYEWGEDSGGPGMGLSGGMTYKASADSNLLLTSWLMEEGDVLDPVHTNPDQLIKILKNIPIEILNARLKEQIGVRAKFYQRVGNWEKEI